MVLCGFGGSLNRSWHLTSWVAAGKFDDKSGAEEPRKGTLDGRPQDEAEKATGPEKRKPASTFHDCPCHSAYSRLAIGLPKQSPAQSSPRGAQVFRKHPQHKRNAVRGATGEVFLCLFP